MFQEPIATFIVIPMCCCAIGCQHSTLNRLFGSWFGCVFLVWRHHLRIIAAHFQTLFSTIFLFLTFLNIHIYFIILKTYDQQFTLTTKKSLHIIFKSTSYDSYWTTLHTTGLWTTSSYLNQCFYGDVAPEYKHNWVNTWVYISGLNSGSTWNCNLTTFLL